MFWTRQPHHFLWWKPLARRRDGSCLRMFFRFTPGRLKQRGCSEWGCGPDLQIPGPFARISNFKWTKWLNNRETRLVVEPPISRKICSSKVDSFFSSKSGIKNQKIVETWNRHQPEIFIVRFAQVAPGRSEDQQPHEFWIHPLDALPCWKKWIFLKFLK